MTLLRGIDLDDLHATLRRLELDGWLLYDFHGVNPIARRVVGFSGMVTRRLFVWLPAVGMPHLVVHSIDHHAFHAFPGTVEEYTRWGELHQRLAPLVRGRRVAVEVSPDNAVPYLDRVPAGVTELLHRLGAMTESSAPLVTRFAARWSAAELDDHRAAAEILARIAKDTMRRVVAAPGSADEYRVQQEILEAMAADGLETIDPPIVGFGAHAADPHYAPAGTTSATLEADQVVLIDLWGRRGPETVWADQTWMGFAGTDPGTEIVRVWEGVRDARDAVIAALRAAAGGPVTGAELDQAARGVLTARGYGEAFVHRTGHSIDSDLHGSGPHLDDFETHDIRELQPGVAFSVEPGVYLPGRFGVRSEVNVVLSETGPEVTPREVQTALILPDG